jgi:hypothetical protein
MLRSLAQLAQEIRSSRMQRKRSRGPALREVGRIPFFGMAWCCTIVPCNTDLEKSVSSSYGAYPVRRLSKIPRFLKNVFKEAWLL